MVKLICPSCKSPLKYDETKLVCCNCNKEFQIKDEIFDFINNEKLQRESFDRKFLEVALKVGITKVMRQIPSDLQKYIYNDSRADWIFHCLDLDNTESCLDLGSGWGTIAFPLSRWYDEVWSLEKVLGRIKFQMARKKGENANLFIVRGNMLNLPFPENSFDLICLNGVLEWTGVDSPLQNPAIAQLNFLSEIRNMLKGNGCLYIGIENRFGIPYWLGSKDHEGLPFTSILPRGVSGFLSKILMRKKYLTYTYNYTEYKKLLRKAGFNEINIYWVMPSYHFPMCSGLVNDIEGFRLYLSIMEHQTKKLPKKALLKFGKVMPESITSWALKFLCPDFLIFAWKRSKKTFESKLLQIVGADSFLRCSMGDSAKIHYLILKNGRIDLTIEIPRSKEELRCVIDNIREELCRTRKSKRG